MIFHNIVINSAFYIGPFIPILVERNVLLLFDWKIMHAPTRKYTQTVIYTCCALLAATLLWYTGYRAYSLSFTHDESLSYQKVIHDSFMQIVSNNTHYVSANNHILNSLFMKWQEQLFGSSELSLRLHSLLAHAVFLFFTFKIIADITSRSVGNVWGTAIILPAYILVHVNPYLLDFFSLARGYALAIALMTVSIYYFLQFLNHTNQRTLAISLTTACMAVLANFAVLTFLFALFAVFELHVLVKRDGAFSVRYFIGRSSPILITLVIMVIVCYEPIRKLVVFNELYAAGINGFWIDTVGSLVHTFLYYRNDTELAFTVLCWFVLATFIAVVARLLLLLVRGKLAASFDKQLPAMLLALFVLIPITESWVMQPKFPMDRFALFIVPVFMLSVVALLCAVAAYNRIAAIFASVIIFALAAAGTYHFARVANLDYCYNWKYDADTKAMMTDLEKLAVKDASRPVKLGINWVFEPASNYYRTTRRLQWLSETDRSGFTKPFNYYFVEPKDFSGLPGKRVIKVYTVTGNVLCQD